MAKPAPEYELVLMLDPEVGDERRDQIAADTRKRIEAAAALLQERAWGLRKMAYEIEQRTEADYRFFRFGDGKAVLDDLNHNLKITDGVLRFRIFKVEAGSPVIDPPPPTSLASGGRPGADRGESRPPRGPDAPSSEPTEAGSVAAEQAPVEPEAPTTEPEASIAEPEAPAAEPQAPPVEPEAPTTEPEASIAEPEAPPAEPETNSSPEQP